MPIITVRYLCNDTMADIEKFHLHIRISTSSEIKAIHNFSFMKIFQYMYTHIYVRACVHVCVCIVVAVYEYIHTFIRTYIHLHNIPIFTTYSMCILEYVCMYVPLCYHYVMYVCTYHCGITM